MALTPAQDQIRLLAESSLEAFIRLVCPQQVLGGVHMELCEWLTAPSRKAHQLVLLPRDHGKSRIAAFYALWELTKDPTKRILYISSTSKLAEQQLAFIMDLMQTRPYRRYWPTMTDAEEGKRTKWTQSEFKVDHPLRKAEGVRDPSMLAAGLTTQLTGFHFDVAILDDVVVSENAYSEEGREKVRRQYSLLSSIEGADMREVAVGTRYDHRDLYNSMREMAEDIFDDDGNVIERRPVYDIYERVVEDAGDGSGEYLWPREQRSDGKWFGFNQQILATKKAKYLDISQFYSQYYNNPNVAPAGGINRANFQYWEPEWLKHNNYKWFMSKKPLNIVAAVDFGFSVKLRADSTVIVVVGIDVDNNYYVLDIDRFKSTDIAEYGRHILAMYDKWKFSRLVAEVNVGQAVIVNDLKLRYFRPNGVHIEVLEHRPVGGGGNKDERIWSALAPRYSNKAIYHYRGGNCQVLEEELTALRPAHDDVKDALSMALPYLTAPSAMRGERTSSNNVLAFERKRFGGY